MLPNYLLLTMTYYFDLIWDMGFQYLDLVSPFNGYEDAKILSSVISISCSRMEGSGALQLQRGLKSFYRLLA